MITRRKAREVAFQYLYECDLALQAGLPVPDLVTHFNHFEVPPGIRAFSSSLAKGTLENLAELDKQIEGLSAHWKLSRMSTVDRNLLRMAAHELAAFPDIPTSVTIDEAIELAKKFGTAESPPFVNGILDAIARACRGTGDAGTPGI